MVSSVEEPKSQRVWLVIFSQEYFKLLANLPQKRKNLNEEHCGLQIDKETICGRYLGLVLMDQESKILRGDIFRVANLSSV